MPLFMTQAKLTAESFQAMINKPSDRPAAVARVFEAHGGTVVQFYWVFGESDVIIIYQIPSSRAAMAALLTLSSGGAVEFHKTILLVSNEEAMEAMVQAGAVDTGYLTPREEWEGWQDYGGEA